MAQLLSNFGADLTGPRQGASCAAREKTPSFLQPIRVCRHALAQHMVELAYVDTLSYETVRQTLKKERPQTAPEKDMVSSRQALG